MDKSLPDQSLTRHSGTSGRRTALGALSAGMAVLAGLGLAQGGDAKKNGDGKNRRADRKHGKQKKRRKQPSDAPAPEQPAGPAEASAEGTDAVTKLLGLRGPTGPTGPTGPAGIAGAAGEPGPQGLQGVPGDTGPTGPAGPQGTSGTAGVPIVREGTNSQPGYEFMHIGSEAECNADEHAVSGYYRFSVTGSGGQTQLTLYPLWVNSLPLEGAGGKPTGWRVSAYVASQLHGEGGNQYANIRTYILCMPD